VDREIAKRNVTAGLVTGGLAALVFALAFVTAIFYISP
jgi:hypothetical protein